MRTKRIKAANVRIGDVVYGFGEVESIDHLDRNTVDIYITSPGKPARLTIDFDDLVEIVTHNSNQTGN